MPRLKNVISSVLICSLLASSFNGPLQRVALAETQEPEAGARPTECEFCRGPYFESDSEKESRIRSNAGFMSGRSSAAA